MRNEAPVRFQFRRQLQLAVEIAIQAVYGRALGRQAAYDGAADAAGRSRDHRSTSGERAVRVCADCCPDCRHPRDLQTTVRNETP